MTGRETPRRDGGRTFGGWPARTGAQPFGVQVGARFARLVDGGAVLEAPIRNELLQQDGLVHGGMVGYPADNALTFAGGSDGGEMFCAAAHGAIASVASPEEAQ